MLGMYLQEAPEVRIETVTEEEETVSEDDDGEEVVETEDVEKDVLYVTATQAMQMNQQWMFQKQQIAQDLMRADSTSTASSSRKSSRAAAWVDSAA